MFSLDELLIQRVTSLQMIWRFDCHAYTKYTAISSAASQSGLRQIGHPCSPSGRSRVTPRRRPASMIDQESCSALSRRLVEQLLGWPEVAEGTGKAAEASCLLEAASPPRLRTRCACCSAKIAHPAIVTAEIALLDQGFRHTVCP